MVTFFIALAILIIGYIFYSRISEKIFSVNTNNLTPAMKNADGVDIVPIKKWKAFLIELLNIAGTGPIFGAISGALFGPIVFIWIVVGCIFGGAVHDFYCGMISSRNNGNSIVALAGKYVGKAMKIIMYVISLVLLLLVTTVFIVSPSTLLETLFNGKVSAWIFMVIILIYFLVATVLPINKIIGRIYPFFGTILLIMAVSVFAGIFIKHDTYPLIEIINNFKDFSASAGGLPWWPFMFTTVACGAVSGFHATQTPLVSKCIRSEKDGRQVFYGAMVAEGVIALIWAAIAMAFFRLDDPTGLAHLVNQGGGNSTTVYNVCKTILGPVGSILAIIGVIICPITSGDTALRSARLIIGELFKIDQKRIKNRLLVTIPIFVIIIAISLWDFYDPKNFSLLWNWFSWSNQTLAMAALLVCSFYLLKHCKYKYGFLITAIPMWFMFAVTFTYLLTEPKIALGYYIPRNIGLIISGVVTGLFIVASLIYAFLFKKSHPKPLDDAI